MGKNIGKNVRKNLSGKYSQKLLDHAKEPAADKLKTTSKRANQKAADATGDLIGNKIADRITKVSKNSQQNNPETVTNEHDKEIPKERYISLEERQGINDKLRLKQFNNGITKNHKSFKKLTTSISETVTSDNDKGISKEIHKEIYIYIYIYISRRKPKKY